jgi:hypothetical protein
MSGEATLRRRGGQTDAPKGQVLPNFGLSNRRELGAIDRNSLKSTSKPLACLNRVRIVSPRRTSPAGLTGIKLASVCPSGLHANLAECWRMMTQD